MVFGRFVAAVDVVMAENEAATCPSCGEACNMVFGTLLEVQVIDVRWQIGSAVSRLVFNEELVSTV